MKIFIISLKKDEARREHAKEVLAPFDFDYEFFDAVNGAEGLPDDLAGLPDDKHRILFRSRPLEPGERGAYASHYRLWQKCVELNEPIVILEDDFLPTEFFSPVLKKLPLLHEKYDYLRLEFQHGKFDHIEYSHNIEIVQWQDNSKGANAYSITPQGAKQFLAASERWLCAVDNFISECYRHKVPALGVLSCATIAPCAFASNIQGKKTKIKLIYKALRECYRFYRFVRMSIWNIQTRKRLVKIYDGDRV